ncbi:MAG TPA: NAD(P)H-dependent oxidoreductase [Symbiobacteriaceae bacterium]|nr:NAD(P)H-dependent oxidoreductase [Symbiobacteriaceae bacterium]
MNILIVLAHPEPKSFNHAMTRTAVQTFQEQGHTVQVSDLYAMQFNPVLDRHDFTAISNPDFFKPQFEQMQATAKQTFAPEVAAEQEKLRWADLVIFQFPLYWFSIPAMLKGWMDRVLAMGFAYGGGKWYDQGAFRGKKALLSFTTGGPAHIYSPTGINGDINMVLFHVQHGMLYFCGFDVIEPFAVWSAAHGDDAMRQRHLERYAEYLRSIETQPLVQFHPLSDYDEKLQLK